MIQSELLPGVWTLIVACYVVISVLAGVSAAVVSFAAMFRRAML